VIGFEAEMNLPQRHKAPHEKARSDQKSKRESDLKHNDRVTQAAVAETAADPLPAITQRIVEVAASRLERRHQPENQRSRYGNGQSKE
jgi:hypothetical protein